jgi:hypothetical protein
MESYSYAQGIVPSNTLGLNYTTRALCCGAAGTVTVDMAGGQIGVTLTLGIGISPVHVTKVYSTGTTATGIVGLW